MILGVPKESFPGETRVAITPMVLSQLKKAKIDVVVESGAGAASGFADSAYAEAGAKVASRSEAFSSDVVAQVRALGSNPEAYASELSAMREGTVLIAMVDPLNEPTAVAAAAKKGVTAFSLELVPRITRAQSMDVLSSQANLAGYKAVLLAAVEMPKILPMMTTAAGTIAPAKALVLGAGVAGLQAIATAKRLGAVVSAYDVRPEVKQQIESLGGKFVELDIESAVGEGGYAKKMSDEYYARQRELLGNVIAENDFVITTAAVPGGRSPILIDKRAVELMRPGSVIIDLAAERGGNCELVQPGKVHVHNGVKIVGPLNLPATMPTHASQLYAKNVVTFLLNMVGKEGFKIDLSDEIVKGSLVCQGGEVVHERIAPLLNKEAATV